MPTENTILIYLFYIIYKIIISKIRLAGRAESTSKMDLIKQCYFRCFDLLLFTALSLCPFFQDNCMKHRF